jgi:hypothetical protein
MKNYADIYNSTNDAIALEQKWYIKEETTRGTLIAPTDSDFFFTLGGGSIEFSQPFESSPHRSGRHHTNIIKKKKECSFGFSSFFNIDTSLGAASTAEIDPAMRVLFKSLLGKEDTVSGLKYTATVPNLTFSLYECGDKFARQARGGFVMGGNMQFPGDGEASVEWSGNAKDALYLGIGKSVTNNTGGNTVTLAAGDGDLFRQAIGGLVMIIEANGTTRSTDTPNGTPRSIVSVTGDIVLLSGATLADADGSGVSAPVYLAYYEPATATAINDPQTGLVGTASIASIGSVCARSIGINIQNDHELVNYCYGHDALDAPFYVPGSRLTAEVTMELNLNKELLKFFNRVQGFEAQVVEVVLGAAAGRRLDIDMPKVFFPVPSFALPDTGSIPVTFTGNAYQTALEAEDEISVHFK